MGETLLIRADANSQIGTGHVMRCLALAQAWQDVEGQAVFAMATECPALEARLIKEGMQVSHLSAQPGGAEDVQQTVGLGLQKDAIWIVVDGYQFGAEYQRALKSSGLRTFWIDDYGHAEYYHADVVLNQNLYANEDFYPKRGPHTRLLLGTRYVLLRREFSKWRGWRREIPEVARKVLITLGGCDPENMTGKLIQAVPKMEIPGLEVKIVVGPANPHLGTLRRAAQASPINLKFLTTVNDMTRLMAWADLAVSAAGSTSWELAFMGLPSMILVLAENQRKAAQVLAEKEMFLSLGCAHDVEVQRIAQKFTNLSLNREMRQKLSQNCATLVDGLGAYWVVQTLSEICIKGKRS